MDVIPKIMQTIRVELRKGRGEELSIPQFRVLAAITCGHCHNKEIGDVLGVSEAAISRMIDGLVTDGLIKKGSNKVDRRLTVLSLTTTGQKFFNMAKAEATARLKTRLESIAVHELDSIIKALRVLKENPQILTN